MRNKSPLKVRLCGSLSFSIWRFPNLCLRTALQYRRAHRPVEHIATSSKTPLQASITQPKSTAPRSISYREDAPIEHHQGRSESHVRSLAQNCVKKRHISQDTDEHRARKARKLSMLKCDQCRVDKQKVCALSLRLGCDSSLSSLSLDNNPPSQNHMYATEGRN